MPNCLITEYFRLFIDLKLNREIYFSHLTDTDKDILEIKVIYQNWRN